MPISNDQAKQIDRSARLKLSPEMIEKLGRKLTAVLPCRQTLAKVVEMDEGFFHTFRMTGR